MSAAGRRPTAARSLSCARLAAKSLADRGVSPNSVSLTGLVFAAMGGAVFAASSAVSDAAGGALLVFGAACIALRLACNLLDGMVALEEGRAEPDGALWNEAPDRVSDVLLLAGAGVGVGLPWLGLVAGCGALLAAYSRVLGDALRAPGGFEGAAPKTTRMAILGAGCILGGIEIQVTGGRAALVASLGMVLAGSLWTFWARIRELRSRLRAS